MLERDEVEIALLMEMREGRAQEALKAVIGGAQDSLLKRQGWCLLLVLGILTANRLSVHQTALTPSNAPAAARLSRQGKKVKIQDRGQAARHGIHGRRPPF